MKAKLNLGCGKRFRPGWTNVDVWQSGKSVLVHDLRHPLPFDSESFDLVYHSHVLEHFSKQDAEIFLSECVRVIKPGGVLRVVVPDLEGIVREYLRLLEHAKSSMESVNHDYAWIMLEMYDQTVRNHAGGQMAKFLLSESLANEAYVVSRVGDEARNIIQRRKSKAEANVLDEVPSKSLIRLLRRIFGRAFRFNYRMWLIQRLLSEQECESLKIGMFRLGGEIHQWMYDECSLRWMLERSGLSGIRRVNADESSFPGWKLEHLDTNQDQSIYKPDSLYMEGVKEA